MSEVKNQKFYYEPVLTLQSHIIKRLSMSYMRIKKLVNLKSYLISKIKYYFSNILSLSLIDHGNIVYHSLLTNIDSKSVTKLQSTCFRFSFNIPCKHHISSYLKNHSILSMGNRRKFHSYIYL